MGGGGDIKPLTWLACEGIRGNLTLFFAWVFPSVSALVLAARFFILANHPNHTWALVSAP